MGQTVAASTTFPLLFLAIYWKGLTAAGAIAAGLFGLVTSVGGIVMGPAFWVKALGNEMPIIPTDYPALVTVPLTFLCARSEEHTSELQSLMRISYAVFCLKTNIYNSIILSQSHNPHIIIHI